MNQLILFYKKLMKLLQNIKNKFKIQIFNQIKFIQILIFLQLKKKKLMISQNKFKNKKNFI